MSQPKNWIPDCGHCWSVLVQLPAPARADSTPDWELCGNGSCKTASPPEASWESPTGDTSPTLSKRQLLPPTLPVYGNEHKTMEPYLDLGGKWFSEIFDGVFTLLSFSCYSHMKFSLLGLEQCRGPAVTSAVTAIWTAAAWGKLWWSEQGIKWCNRFALEKLTPHTDVLQCFQFFSWRRMWQVWAAEQQTLLSWFLPMRQTVLLLRQGPWILVYKLLMVTQVGEKGRSGQCVWRNCECPSTLPALKAPVASVEGAIKTVFFWFEHSQESQVFPFLTDYSQNLIILTYKSWSYCLRGSHLGKSI